MVSSSSLARVATAGFTSSTDASKQQKAWAKEYFSRWFFVTAPMSRNRHRTATFSTGNVVQLLFVARRGSLINPTTPLSRLFEPYVGVDEVPEDVRPVRQRQGVEELRHGEGGQLAEL
ncbi:hypothetical protein EYF80_005497 [Liparis tanakae]|uniref:Uncharacterized protein n=1 Tax=Liparis tanakae TaxID=230148 RepID=A0A4Z2J1N3_9TELE|nr:hypothetical protein EYF80_005497 [Liparis tanakae]